RDRRRDRSHLRAAGRHHRGPQGRRPCARHRPGAALAGPGRCPPLHRADHGAHAQRLTVADGAIVDSNVLLDVLTEDVDWLEWSSNALAAAAEAGPLFINPIIYAEVSIRFSRVEDVDDALPPSDYGRLALPWEAAFLAGKAFVGY